MEYVFEIICCLCHISVVTWAVEFADEFEVEFDTFTEPVKVELLARAKCLASFGPTLGRPQVGTLNGSRYRNMKELRFNAGVEVWRVVFAFDPERRAILLCGGSKDGKDQKRFYRDLLRIADRRFEAHLESLGQ